MIHLYLSRSNLDALIEKLDRNVRYPGSSVCTIMKQDTVHPKYPLTGAPAVTITAVEDSDYYVDRVRGLMLEDFLP